MKAIIDGIEYVPAPEILDTGLEAALELRFDSDVGENITIREYFQKLFLTLWEKGEKFNSKRPFGDSGWKYDIAAPLVEAGFLQGRLDDEGYLFDCDNTELEKLGANLIKLAMRKS